MGFIRIKGKFLMHMIISFVIISTFLNEMAYSFCISVPFILLTTCEFCYGNIRLYAKLLILTCSQYHEWFFPETYVRLQIFTVNFSS